MEDKGLRILRDIFWLLFCIGEVGLGILHMVDAGTITWHLAFVIIFSVMFGMWFVLLIKDVFEKED